MTQVLLQPTSPSALPANHRFRKLLMLQLSVKSHTQGSHQIGNSTYLHYMPHIKLVQDSWVALWKVIFDLTKTQYYSILTLLFKAGHSNNNLLFYRNISICLRLAMFNRVKDLIIPHHSL